MHPPASSARGRATRSIGDRPRAAAGYVWCHTPRHGMVFFARETESLQHATRRWHTDSNTHLYRHSSTQPFQDRIDIVVQQPSDNSEGGCLERWLLAASISWYGGDAVTSRQTSDSRRIRWRAQDASRAGSHRCERSSEINRLHRQPFWRC
jgi:hypothetical protein